MEETWIKLYRKITQWDWFTDSKTFHVFVYLLLSANIRDGKMKNRQIRRGQAVTSYMRIAMSTGMSVSSARRAIENLVSTGEIIVEPTNHYTLVTIVKYDSYQEKYAIPDQADTQPQGSRRRKTGRRKSKTADRSEPETRKEIPEESTEEKPYIPQYWERNIPKQYHGRFSTEDEWWDYVNRNKSEVEAAYEL